MISLKFEKKINLSLLRPFCAFPFLQNETKNVRLRLLFTDVHILLAYDAKTPPSSL